jgi:hypothetical protein
MTKPVYRPPFWLVVAGALTWGAILGTVVYVLS